MALLSSINFYFDCKARLCLIVPGRQEKIYLCTRKLCFYLQGILEDINKQYTSFLDCKHKLMMKRGSLINWLSTNNVNAKQYDVFIIHKQRKVDLNIYFSN